MSDAAANTAGTPAGEPVMPPEPGAPFEPPVAEPAATQPSPGETPPTAEEPLPKSESLIDAIADLLQMAVNYLRQEAAGVMRDKVVLPGQVLGKMIAFAFAAAFLFALGIGFVAVALLLLLAEWLTWPGALGLIGGVLLLGAAIFTYLKIRSTQK